MLVTSVNSIDPRSIIDAAYCYFHHHDYNVYSELWTRFKLNHDEGANLQ